MKIRCHVIDSSLQDFMISLSNWNNQSKNSSGNGVFSSLMLLLIKLHCRQYYWRWRWLRCSRNKISCLPQVNALWTMGFIMVLLLTQQYLGSLKAGDLLNFGCVERTAHMMVIHNYHTKGNQIEKFHLFNVRIVNVGLAFIENVWVRRCWRLLWVSTQISRIGIISAFWYQKMRRDIPARGKLNQQ